MPTLQEHVYIYIYMRYGACENSHPRSPRINNHKQFPLRSTVALRSRHKAKSATICRTGFADDTTLIISCTMHIFMSPYLERKLC